MLGAGKSTGGQLGDDLRGVGHACVGEMHMGEGVSADDAQPVVCVREIQARAQPGRRSSQAQHRAFDPTHRRRGTRQETRAEDEREILPTRPLDHGGRLGGIVLAVGVEGHHVSRPAGESGIESGLEGSALPQVERVSRGVGPRGAGDGSGVVTRSVIDDEDTRKKGADSRDDAPDDGRLVERGDYHPRVGADLHLISVAHRDGRAPIVWGIRKGTQCPNARTRTRRQRQGDPVIEPSADIAPSAIVAPSARVWHLAQVRENARIGDETIVGRGAYIGEGVRVGARCKIQNYALVYEPASLADGVFVGPAAVFTNDHCPRAINADGTLKSASDWDRVGVTVERGAAIGARAVCVAPVRIGAWASVGAGAVVTSDVAPYALVVGVPARRVGWVGEAGVPLVAADDTASEAGDRTWVCPASGRRYVERDGALSPEEAQASSPHDAEMPDQNPEDQQ